MYLDGCGFTTLWQLLPGPTSGHFAMLDDGDRIQSGTLEAGDGAPLGRQLRGITVRMNTSWDFSLAWGMGR